MIHFLERILSLDWMKRNFCLKRFLCKCLLWAWNGLQTSHFFICTGHFVVKKWIFNKNISNECFLVFLANSTFAMKRNKYDNYSIWLSLSYNTKMVTKYFYFYCEFGIYDKSKKLLCDTFFLEMLFLATNEPIQIKKTRRLKAIPRSKEAFTEKIASIKLSYSSAMNRNFKDIFKNLPTVSFCLFRWKLFTIRTV